MIRRVWKLVLLAGVTAGLTATTSIATATPPNASPNARHAMPAAHGDKATCAATQPGYAHCDAHVVTQADGASPMATTSYSYGYRPADLQAAYGVGAGTGTPTVAIVDAYDNPKAEADLAAYRSQFGLPACTTANGCFAKRNQNGGTTYPTGSKGWGQEIALDLDMVSAVCPNCHILLVEATSSSMTDLMAAVDFAAAHAGYVSNSYGGSEFNGEQSYDTHFDKPGIVFTVSSGDDGYGAEYPAASRYVTAVGGTTLNLDSAGHRTSEKVWSGAGSGCSAYIAKPTWQHDTGCARRTIADVAAVANPSTGVAVYDSYGSGGANWYVFGGTSVAAPVVAGIYAVAGVPASTDNAASYPYAAPTGLFDVTSGSNGSCSPAYLCTGAAGYDGPTGLGAPNGVAAFAAPGTVITPPPPPPGDQPPVIDSATKSCSAKTCTFTITAHDPDGATLTYAWTGASTTNTAVVKFTSAGGHTVSADVSDGTNSVAVSFSVNCVQRNKLVCS
ncbi:MAG TPA: S53 family peptidase [Acidimicrobiales bacterium]|nr:S53 family peptidase [Acidimicrobiales bacterium]